MSFRMPSKKKLEKMLSKLSEKDRKEIFQQFGEDIKKDEEAQKKSFGGQLLDEICQSLKKQDVPANISTLGYEKLVEVPLPGYNDWLYVLCYEDRKKPLMIRIFQDYDNINAEMAIYPKADEIPLLIKALTIIEPFIKKYGE